MIMETVSDYIIMGLMTALSAAGVYLIIFIITYWHDIIKGKKEIL